MININELRESDKKRKVIYQANGFTDEGYITSWNSTFIFVDYHGEGKGHATRPEDLKFITE